MAKDPYPSVKFTEETRLTAIANTLSSFGASTGRFQRGTVGKGILINDIPEFTRFFGEPTEGLSNFSDWYTISNFLNYTAGCYVTRVTNGTSLNAGLVFHNGSTSAIGAFSEIKDGYDMSNVTDITNTGINIVAKNPGTWGNALKVSMVMEADLALGLDASTEWDGLYYDNEITLDLSAAAGTLAVGEYAMTEFFNDTTKVKTYLTGLVTAVTTGPDTVTIAYNGTALAYTGAPNTYKLQPQTTTWTGVATVDITATSAVTVLNYGTVMGNFNENLETNDIAIVVYETDTNGIDQVVETHIVSTVENTKGADGKNKFTDDWLEKNSNYISSVTAGTPIYLSVGVPASLALGDDGGALTAGDIIIAQDEVYKDPTNVQFAFLMDGAWAGNTTVMNNIINIMEFRKDSFGVLSSGTAITTSNPITYETEIKAMREALTDSDYYAFYNTYKIQFDPFTGKNISVPFSGDIAGMMARGDLLGEVWLPPAGFNRGGLKDVVKLPIAVSKTLQGELHLKQINVIIEDKKIGGFFVNSQKTGTGRATPMADINIRRLFTYMEINSVEHLNNYLWEFNDVTTRDAVNSLLTNFIAGIKAKQGVVEFKIVVDETNNPQAIIDTNQLIINVFVKPTKAIHNIAVRFTATRSDAKFEELTA